MELLPPKEKKRYLQLSHKTTPAEVQEAEAELRQWARSVSQVDESLCSNSKSGDALGHVLSSTTGSSHKHAKSLPAVRGSANAASSSGASGAKVGAAGISPSSVQPDAEDAEIYTRIGKCLSNTQRRKLDVLRAQLEVGTLTMVVRKYKAGRLLVVF